jgi:hypothetical protein
MCNIIKDLIRYIGLFDGLFLVRCVCGALVRCVCVVRWSGVCVVRW